MSPRWPKDHAADAADVAAAATTNIAAATASMRAGVVDGAVGAAAALDASVVDDPAVDCDLNHCHGDPRHGLRL